MNFLKAFLGGSKKLSVVFAGILIVIFRDALGLPDEVAKMIAEMIVAYLFGQSVVDSALAWKGRKTS